MGTYVLLTDSLCTAMYSGLGPGKGYVDVSTVDAATSQVRSERQEHSLQSSC
jgi:hypothetical protein